VNGVFYVARENNSIGTMTLSGGTVNAKNAFYVARGSGSTGTVTVSGGSLTNSGTFYLGSANANAKSHLTIQGDDASIYVNSLDCSYVSDDTITFTLDGTTGSRISTINCGSATFGNSAKIEYKLTEDFHGSANDTYTLISSGTAINTNGCVFTDSTGTPAGTFTISLENSGKELRLTQHNQYPIIHGTTIILR
jgi:T5SS/PEP-CTERM-associated repeat protein